MKKVLILFLLSMVATANAGLFIMVKLPDSPLWGEYAESKFTIVQSDLLWVGIFTDNSGQPQPGSHAVGLTEGLGSIDDSSIVTYVGTTATMQDDAVAAAELGLQNPFISMEVPSITDMGRLLTKFLFHCDGPGDVTFAVVDENGQILDTQVIHQIPEPMTMVLLGLGGLAMAMSRKRSA